MVKAISPSNHADVDEPFGKLPVHVAIIMDGNGRWAKQRDLSANAGHKAGTETVRRVLRLCRDKGVKIVTLWAFSTENWSRPAMEVKGLMTLFSTYLKKEVKQLNKDGVRIRFIGERNRFNKSLCKQMENAERLTATNTDTTLVIAVDYGGKWDITNAARHLAEQVAAGELAPEDIDEERLGAHMCLADLPPPDLFIRTSGEQRLSNYLLWQLAYTEFHFTDTLWPDFDEADLQLALVAYADRDRRYGGRNDA